MLRRYLRRQIEHMEGELGIPLRWARELLGDSLPAFLKFALIRPVTAHRKHLSREAFAVGRLAAVKHDDCGECVHEAVFFARKDGVAKAVLRAALASDLDALPEDLALVYRFSEAVCANDAAAEALREGLEKRIGRSALLELALQITTVRMFPLLKRALGYAPSCAAFPFDLERLAEPPA